MKKDHRYSGYFRKHTWLIVLATIMTALSTFADLYVTSVMSSLVAELSNQHSIKNLYHYTAIMFFVEAASLLLKFYSEKILLRVKASIIRSLHWDLAAHLAEASSESVTQNDPAFLSARLREGTSFTNAIEDIYREVFNLFSGIIALVYVFTISWQIATMILVSLSIILVVQIHAIKKMIKKRSASFDASDATKQLSLEIIKAFPAIKSQGLTYKLREHYSQSLNEEYTLSIESNSISASNSCISNWILSGYKVVFLLLGGFLVTHSLLNFENFVTLFMYKIKIDGLVGASLRLARGKAELETSIIRMNDVFNFKKISKEHFGSNKLYPASGHISIKGLTVCYGNTKVLDNLSLEIPSGKFIGIVGDSGCGKSTLLKVLARQQTPVAGQVLLDGLDMWNLDQWSYQKAITMAPQMAYLFTLSVKENLLLADPNASDGKIWAALEECAAADFVYKRGGLDTVISPSELSGGEQQRLALARIAVRGAKIVLMDESTSALDGHSQGVVIKTVKKAVANGHTMIMVAHRLSTLKDADLIVHLEDGKVLETGSFSELYEKSEKFRRLVDLS